ncbi:DUF4245 domain-containing protein [Streptomyces sp. NP-1717]|uniref:DUF4245 domain-containing protein n=1 Tax=unclassified Streptomyces TaxID=2593676 RepID=UPI0027E5B67E|nr:DUF4245 domain-containing protein [Streptomyces sp. NP-1717]MCI3221946.1 DUF4245 domain-containing protein [Streptomyces sp. NP-1717]WTA75521.1 DUF4245 domain-containing protein [Streptomyces sp. NBC_00838]
MAAKRGNQTVRSMFLSMAVVVAVAGAFYLVNPHDEDADPLPAVDYRVELVTAQRAAPYPVLAPKGLPKTWKPTSVSYARQDGDSWHLGFLDPDREYVAVEQSTASARKYIADVTHRAENTGKTARVGGETWQRWEGPKYDALVRAADGATTVVTGTAPYERLVEMVEALESDEAPAPGSGSGSDTGDGAGSGPDSGSGEA